MNYLGYHGPYLLSFLTAILIWNRTPYLVSFLVGGFANTWLNVFLKMVFQEPRPKSIDLMEAKKVDWFGSFFDIDIHKAHRYGMPSGHAQIASFAVAYWYFLNEKKIVNGKIWETMIGLSMVVLLINTLHQRWETEAHSFGQLAMGVFVGGGFSWVVFMFTKYILCQNQIMYIR